MDELEHLWQVRQPCQVHMTGASQSGKSETLLKMVEHDKHAFAEGFDTVVYAAPRLDDQDIGSKDKDYIARLQKAAAGKRLMVCGNVPDVSHIVDGYRDENVLLALDDLTNFSDLSRVGRLGSMDAHHLGISTVYLYQSPTQKAKGLDLLTLRRNKTGELFFMNHNDRTVMATQNSRLYPDNRGFLARSLDHAWERFKVPYIYCNTQSYTRLPRRYSCYTAIFKELEHGPFFFDAERG